jgi:RNA polymerase-binding transcription factor DksA
MSVPDTERAIDVIDQGSQTERLFLDASLKKQLGKSAPQKDERFDGVHCVEEDCGVEIAKERVELGRVRCIDCQRLIEAREHQRRA